MTALLVLVIFLMLAIAVAIPIARQVQKGVTRLNNASGEELKKYGFLSDFHGYYVLIAFGIALFKRVYTSWKYAPEGSIVQYGWGIALALIIAGAIWMVIKFIDWKINGAHSETDKQPYQP